MTATESFKDFLREKQQLTEQRLQQLVPPADREPAGLHESVRYSLFADAKRIRPVFCLAVARSLRMEEDEVLDPACAVGMIHTSSLILDDLPCMDGATLRRGKAANHLVFGEDTAILAAMYLLTRAYGVLAEYRKSFFSAADSIQLVGIVSKALTEEGVISGQMVDLESKGKKIGLDVLEFIHSRKTGSLFYACAEVAAVLAGARERERISVLNFAKNLGLAFQITDDILDATGTASEIGKDTGQDVGKTTFLTFCGLDGAKQLANELIETAELSLSGLRRPELLHSFAEFVRTRTK